MGDCYTYIIAIIITINYVYYYYYYCYYYYYFYHKCYLEEKEKATGWEGGFLFVCLFFVVFVFYLLTKQCVHVYIHVIFLLTFFYFYLFIYLFIYFFCLFVVKNFYILEFDSCICKFDKNKDKSLFKKKSFSTLFIKTNTLKPIFESIKTLKIKNT